MQSAPLIGLALAGMMILRTGNPDPLPPASMQEMPRFPGANTLTLGSTNVGTIATISAAGDVAINWRGVEATAADTSRNDVSRSIAIALIAVRDKTYREITP